MSSPLPSDFRRNITTRACYGSGAIVFAFSFSAVNMLAFPILNLGLGMSATLVGVVLAIGRLWDSFSDPVMGWISDNAHTRWGRRRPFILLGGLLCALTFPLIWFVPTGWSESMQFYWVLVAALFFYTATTIYSVPYLSLGYEIDPDPMARTKLQAWRTYFGSVAFLALPWFYRWAQADVFPDVMTGIRWITVAAGAVFFLCALPVFWGCRERTDAVTRNLQKTPLLQGLRETLTNRPFLILVLGIVTSVLCIPMLVASLGLYVNIYHVFGGDTKLGAAYTAAFSTAMFACKFILVPVGVYLTGRFGKLRVVKATLWLGLIASLSKYVLYTPDAPWLQFANVLLLAPSVTVFWLLVDPLKADCADYDEWQTGRRRSATYAAVANWIEKASMSIVLLGSGLLLDWSRFDPGLGAEQPEGTVWILRTAFAVIPAVAYAVALLALRFYSLTDERMAEIRRELNLRNETGPAGGGNEAVSQK